MSVLSTDGWKSRLDQLSPTMDPTSAMSAFAKAIADLTAPLQAEGGTPGILTYQDSIMAAALASLTPTMGSSWANIIASAWGTGLSSSVIKPGTASDPSWSGSGGFDTLTLPTAAATITNAAAAQTSLQSGLAAATPGANSTQAFAQAFRDATLSFKMTLIGLGPPPASSPIPLIKGVS